MLVKQILKKIRKKNDSVREIWGKKVKILKILKNGQVQELWRKELKFEKLKNNEVQELREKKLKSGKTVSKVRKITIKSGNQIYFGVFRQKVKV